MLFIRNGLISLRTVAGKFVCCSISLASGIALGREGPSVQIGAGIASYELDIWGRVADIVKAAKANAEAVGDAFANARLGLHAALVRDSHRCR